MIQMLGLLSERCAGDHAMGAMFLTGTTLPLEIAAAN